MIRIGKFLLELIRCKKLFIQREYSHPYIHPIDGNK